MEFQAISAHFAVLFVNYFCLLTILLNNTNKASSCLMGHGTHCLYWRSKDVMADTCYSGSDATIISTNSVTYCARLCVVSKSGRCFAADFDAAASKCRLFSGGFNSSNVNSPCPGFQLIVLHGARSKNEKVQPQKLSSVGCSNGWVRYADSCYLLVTKPATFPEADNICRTKGALLASIHSGAENGFLASLLYSTQSGVFIGLIKKNLNTKTSDDMLWVDGTVYDYKNWDNQPNQPVNPSNACTQVGVACSFRWNFVDCYQPASFVCKATAA